MKLLEVTKLIKSYTGRRVVNEVSFSLDQQEIVGLLGRNGAGKTTSFRMILGMVTPDAGAVSFDGQDVTTKPMYKRARLKLGYLPQERSDFRRLTVTQNLMAILETLNLTRAERNKRADALLEQYGLTKNRDQLAESLSGGERRKLEIARALVTDPKLILLDEPSLGLSPLLMKEIFGIVKRVNAEEGTSILLVEQNAKMALETAHYGYVLEVGRVVMADKCERLMESKDIQEFYLGGHATEANPRGERRWKNKKTWR